MTVAFQRIFRIMERWNNNQVTPSLSKPHELSYRSNTLGWYLPRGLFSRLNSPKRNFSNQNNTVLRLVEPSPNALFILRAFSDTLVPQ